MDRGAGLLARWLRDFARGGRLASLVEAARRTALRTVDVSLRSRRGGLYRGAGLLARWLRDFARSGRLAALVEAARRTALRTYALHYLAALVEGCLYRGAGLLARWPRGFKRSGRLAALVEAARRTAPRYPTCSDLRAVTSRFAREGGPEDRPTYSAPRTVPYVQRPTYSAPRLSTRIG